VTTLRAGFDPALLDRFAPDLVEHAGGSLGLLATPQHGKPGQVRVLGGALLAGLPREFTAGRYHSLHARPEQVTGGFAVTAVTPDGVVMAIEDEARSRWGVQFHPESILTASGGAGHQVIANVLELCRRVTRTGGGGRRRPGRGATRGWSRPRSSG
jgi:anthranilate synthase